VETFHAKIADKLSKREFEDFNDLLDEWSLLRQYFKEHCKGPALLEVANDFLFPKFSDDVAKLSI